MEFTLNIKIRAVKLDTFDEDQKAWFKCRGIQICRWKYLGVKTDKNGRDRYEYYRPIGWFTSKAFDEAAEYLEVDDWPLRIF